MTPADKARDIRAQMKAKADILANIDPYFIDLSLRENVFGSNLGQTLDNKKAIFPQLRDFGFKNILVGTLDYAQPDAPEVDDHFMCWLRDEKKDVTGCFAFTDIGLVTGGTFKPSRSMEKLRDYCVPNTLHEVYLSPEGMQSAGYTFQQLMDSVPASIDWLNTYVKGDGGGKPRILINIVDGCDAFQENPAGVEQFLTMLTTNPYASQIEGLSIEDDRGTYMPFQVGGFVATARAYLPAPYKLLVHMHSGGGFENASIIESLLNGADGVWGGLPKRAAIIGHASLGELMANLMRLGNPHMAEHYEVGDLLPFAKWLQELDTNSAVPDDEPVLGANAYRLTLSFFEQLGSRYMDLPPDRIGGTYGYRICPLAADPPVLRGRLIETTGNPPSMFPDSIMEQMVRCMRDDLNKGYRIDYDPPDEIWNLYLRATNDARARKPTDADRKSPPRKHWKESHP